MIEVCSMSGHVWYFEEPCEHPDAVPVESVVDGSTVAWLCPGCDAQLPATWR